MARQNARAIDEARTTSRDRANALAQWRRAPPRHCILPTGLDPNWSACGFRNFGGSDMILRVLAKALIPASLVLFAGAAFAGDCNTDLNGDGTTNEADVAIFQGSLGKSAGDEGFVAAADLNGDGSVTAADYGLFLSCN